MVQGTGSGVGKSVVVAALCRIFRQDGYLVAPFKSQNMALNSYPTAEGGEMGRAQVVQAQAASIEPTVEMNPILIKPSSDCLAQLIVNGKPWGNNTPQSYYQKKRQLRKIINESYRSLASKYELIVIEGAGSPAEINLRKQDMVNMYVAKMADAPVVLVGDIDKGGVFAWLYGTLKLLTPSERKRVKGVIINKFRGDIKLLEPGLTMLEQKINLPVLGVIPYYHDIRIEEEDSVTTFSQSQASGHDVLDIAVIYLPHISNFTDFDALELEPKVNLRYLKHSDDLGNPDVLIIPGSKSTISDLQALKDSGLASRILNVAQQGAIIVGICGGFQMLGHKIFDPGRLEGKTAAADGLGLLNISTTITSEKITRQVALEGISSFALNQAGAGYEIHHGKTSLAGAQPLFKLGDGSVDGAISPDSRVWGTYLHGIFDISALRCAFLNQAARLRNKDLHYETSLNKAEFREQEFDKLADHFRKHLDIKRIHKIIEGEA